MPRDISPQPTCPPPHPVSLAKYNMRNLHIYRPYAAAACDVSFTSWTPKILWVRVHKISPLGFRNNTPRAPRSTRSALHFFHTSRTRQLRWIAPKYHLLLAAALKLLRCRRWRRSRGRSRRSRRRRCQHPRCRSRRRRPRRTGGSAQSAAPGAGAPSLSHATRQPRWLAGVRRASAAAAWRPAGAALSGGTLGGGARPAPAADQRGGGGARGEGSEGTRGSCTRCRTHQP